MHNRNILPLHIVHHNLAHVGPGIPIPEEEQVSTLEGGLHGPGEDNDDGRRRVRDHAEGLPEHEGRAEDEGEVEELEGGGARGGEVGGEH